MKALRPNLLYFAVFDGHGGSECADYCYHHFEEHLLFWIERGDCDLQKALDSAFLELNNAYSRWWTLPNWCNGLVKEVDMASVSEEEKQILKEGNKRAFREVIIVEPENL